VAGQLSSQLRPKRKSPSIQAILVIAVALLILFLWLNFVLTQEIESIGREIQEKTQELDAIERRQDSLLKEISETDSQREMASKAWELGYRPQTPIYLLLAEPLPQGTGDTIGDGGWSVSTEGGDEGVAQQTLPLFDLLAHQSGSAAYGSEP
jgi:cytoskeletal protein RodZ